MPLPAEATATASVKVTSGVQIEPREFYFRQRSMGSCPEA